MAKSSSGEGSVLHFGSVRFRITGQGNFLSQLVSLDDVVSVDLPDLTMEAATAKEPLLLTNFVQQRACLVGKTEGINEVFSVSKIVIFVRPIQSGYAQ